MMKKKKSLLIIIIVCLILVLGVTTYLFMNKNVLNNKQYQKAVKPQAPYTTMNIKIKDNYETTPIQLYSKGYLVKVNGKYGFVDVNGKSLIDAKYVSYDKRGMIYNETTPNSDKIKVDICMSESGQYDLSLDDSRFLEYLLGLNPNASPCHSGGFGGTDSRILKWDRATDQALYTDNAISNPSVSFTQADKSTTNSFFNGGCSVYFANEGDYSDVAVYDDMPEQHLVMHILDAEGKAISNTLISKVLSYENVNQVGISAHILGLNSTSAVQRVSDGKWAFLKKDGTFLTKFVYDSAQVLNTHTFKFSKGKTVGIINTAGKILIQGKFEDVSEPINHKALVKINGKWKQIKLNK